MKYMLMFVGDDEEFAKFPPDARKKAYEEIGKWWGEQAAAGRIIGGEELKPAPTATTVRRKSDGKITITDGPFVASKETLGGYAIIEVPDLDAAIELAKGWLPLQTIEIRPLVEQRDESSSPAD